MQSLGFLSVLIWPWYGCIWQMRCFGLSYYIYICLTHLRLFVVRPHPLFWSLKSDSITMLDILLYELRLDTRITTHKLRTSALWLTSSSPALNLECGPCLPSNADTTYHYDPAFTWKWTHKICTLCLWTQFMLSRSTPSAPRLEAKLFERYEVRENCL